MRFNPPPNWPSPPEGWEPPAGWTPDAAWPPPPEGVGALRRGTGRARRGSRQSAPHRRRRGRVLRVRTAPGPTPAPSLRTSRPKMQRHRRHRICMPRSRVAPDQLSVEHLGRPAMIRWEGDQRYEIGTIVGVSADAAGINVRLDGVGPAFRFPRQQTHGALDESAAVRVALAHGRRGHLPQPTRFDTRRHRAPLPPPMTATVNGDEGIMGGSNHWRANDRGTAMTLRSTADDVLGWAQDKVSSKVPRADLDHRDPDYIRDRLPPARGCWRPCTFAPDVPGPGPHSPADKPVLLVGNHSGGNVPSRHGHLHLGLLARTSEWSGPSSNSPTTWS